jgi:hypothetical protein
VFEPLIADRHGELGCNPSMTLRVRWWLALAATCLACLPRAILNQLPATLVVDLFGRALAFGAIATALQIVFARVGHGPTPMPLSVASTLPFILLPVVWRIRVSDLAPHQRRLLAFVAVALATGVTAAAGQTWVTRLSLGAMPILASLCGWRNGDPAFFDSPHVKDRRWTQIVMIASSLQLSSWPATVTMGMQFNRFWPQTMILTYLFGAVVYLSITMHHRARPQAGF